MDIQVETQRFDEVMQSLNDALVGRGEDVSNLLIDEHRRLTNTIVNFTPPLPSGGARQAGELAVKKDLYALISEAKPELIDRIGSKFGIRDVDTYISGQNGKQHLLWENIDVNGTNLKELHNRYRNPRTGRPDRERRIGQGTWKSRIVVPTGMREPYVKQVQSHVGRWKAKWAYAAAQLGAKFPTWIARHFGQSGALMESDLKSDSLKFIVFGARGPGARKNLDSIRSAVKTRTKAMAQRTKLIISGYAKDVAAGMKPKPHAREFTGVEEEVS